MPHKTKANTTLTHKIQTGGEVTVNLVLTIKLDSDGLSLSAGPAKSMKELQTIEIDDSDDVNWVIPEITSGETIQFGDKVDKKE